MFLRPKIKLTFARLVIISMILGIGCGITFGERCSCLALIGQGYIALLQMCILPYVVVSILYGIGRLGIEESRQMAFKGISLTLIFWGLMAVYIVLMPFCFPEWNATVFFSKNVVETVREINYLELYIPANPFYSLANTLVPAITVFCICVGVALISVENKEMILNDFKICCAALMKANNGVVRLAPVGTFALLANLSGTITISEITRIQVYLVTYAATVLLVSFGAVPLLVTAFTDLKYRDVMHTAKDAMLTAIATGNVFVLIPIITQNVRQLLEDKQLATEERRVMLDTIVPISFNFPLGGRILLLVFIPFAAWFYDMGLDWWKYLELAGAGILGLFGSTVTAILFLLNYFHIPSDIIEFFVAFDVVNDRLGALCSSVYLIAFCILCTAWLTGFLKLNWRKIIKNIIIIITATLLTLLGCTVYLRVMMSRKSDAGDILAKMRIGNTVPAKIFKNYPAPQQVKPLSSRQRGDRLQLIKKRGILRVGYAPASRPFSYFDAEGKLMGYDIEMAHLLAKDLGCTLEFIPIEYDHLGRGIAEGVIDIVMAGVSVTSERIKSLHFTRPYMEVNLAFVVKDYQQSEYRLAEDIRRKPRFRVACVPGLSYRDHMKKYYPDLKFVDIESEADFLSGRVKADALLISAEEGFAWCILYPAFSVVVPRPEILKEDLAYVISQDDVKFCQYLNTWLGLKKTDGVLDRLYSYWIMGKNIHQKQERWCIWDKLWK
ncbi:MAG: cation:dicarboxylase symporter family transporter [Victivallaceae bacterium]|nr:cation:dicarboxylase symporter family transporter [Victivallaceae bacterium]